MAFRVNFLKAFAWFVRHIVGLLKYTWSETFAVAICGFCEVYVHQIVKSLLKG